MGIRWRDLPKPTIAEVHGYCIFGGWLIASAMDIIIASEDALFLPSLLQYFSVPWDIGVRKAKEILFQTRFVTAREACELGFVNSLFPGINLRRKPKNWPNGSPNRILFLPVWPSSPSIRFRMGPDFVWPFNPPFPTT